MRRVVLRALARSALAGPAVRCMTYEEKTGGRLQTLCADGPRADLHQPGGPEDAAGRGALSLEEGQ
jgi:hypothetical protein